MAVPFLGNIPVALLDNVAKFIDDHYVPREVHTRAVNANANLYRELRILEKRNEGLLAQLTKFVEHTTDFNFPGTSDWAKDRRIRKTPRRLAPAPKRRWVRVLALECGGYWQYQSQDCIGAWVTDRRHGFARRAKA